MQKYTYICWIHTDAMNRRRKTSLQIYSISHFICKVWKGYSRFARERELEIEQNCNILILTLMAVTLCLSCSPDAQPEAQRPTLLGAGFLTASYQHLLWTPIHQRPKPLRPGVAFPTTSHLPPSPALTRTPTVLTSVLTELYNSSTPTWSPTRSLKSHV